MKLRTLAVAVAASLALPAAAEIAISVQDSKAWLDNGVAKTNPRPESKDNAIVLDMTSMPPKVTAKLELPVTVVGPPTAVAISRDETLALVTSAQKPDPADPSKTINDDRMSVIDLTTSPPKVIATVQAGAGASGVSITRDGKLALVANRNEGTVSVFTINGKTVTPSGKIKLGNETSGPSSVAITPDGTRALVTRDGDHFLSLLKIENGQVTDMNRHFGAGFRPYGADMSSDGKHAVVANVGRNAGDTETVSLFDMTLNPPRVVDTIAVPPTPEGITLSPDGKYAAVVTHNGSGKPKGTPFYNPMGKVVLLKIEGGKLRIVSEAPIGAWAQGSAFSKDGRHLLVQNNVDREIAIFRIDNERVIDTTLRVKTEGHPVSMRTSW